MASARNDVHFENLDGLRFVAFLLVFVFHAFSALQPQSTNAVIRILVSGLTFHFQSGEYGVSFFFVLSGFLISYLIFHDSKATGTFSLKHFYVRRILRIWPLYFVVMAIGFFAFPLFLRAVGVDASPNATFLRYLTFNSNFDIMHRHSYPSPVLAVLWSLAIEEQFYLFWPIILLLVPRKHVPTTLFIFVAGSLLYRVASTNPLADRHSLSAVIYLATGCLLAYASSFSAKFLYDMHRLPRTIICAVYLAGFFLMSIDQMADYHLRHSGTMPMVRSAYQFVRLVFQASFFAFVIGEQNFSAHSFFKIGRLKRVSILGKYTYGLYLLHMIPICIVKYVPIDLASATIVYFVKVSASFVGVLILGYVSYTYFERHFLKLKNTHCATPGCDHSTEGKPTHLLKGRIEPGR